MIPARIELYERLSEKATKEIRQYAALSQGISAQMTPDEYRFLLQTLHPDRAPEDRRDKFAKAFDIVRKLDNYIAVVAKRMKSGLS